ncbi:MAG: hypothetical protein J6D52_05445 [Clostridia bacterium]|nr:hypothetical protein [Clostridia bacterium]
MKAKKLCKTLISLALTLALVLSVCISGLTVFATETTDVTVNVYDGTAASTYTGGWSRLSATAGITGILEGKQVERIVPQYAFSNFLQYSIATTTITEEQIDFTAVKNFSIFFKNDLGDGIQFNLNDYYYNKDETGTTEHSYYFSTDTVYWMVDINKNIAKRYLYRSGGYIYLPEGFEGYIIFDLATCDAESLSNFMACGLDHLMFRLKEFSEKTVGNALYYGDINVSTASADSALTTLAPDAVKQYVAINPITDNAKGVRKINLTPEVVINDYIGQSYKLNVPNSSYALFADTIFTAAESKDCQAIVIPCSTNNGTRPEIAISPIINDSVQNRYGYLKTKYTTINLINNKVVVSDKITSDAVIEDTEFEGYIIAYIDADTKVSCVANTDLGITKGDHSWSDFINYYKDYDIAGIFARNNGSVIGGWEIGELSYVTDVDAFMKKVLPNDLKFSPDDAVGTPKFTVGGSTANGTMEIVDGGEILGRSYKFTVSENYFTSSYNFTTYPIFAREHLKDMGAVVYRMKITNATSSNRTIIPRLGNALVAGTYMAYNTLTGEYKEVTVSSDGFRIQDETFEGYIILDLSTAKVGSRTWNEYIEYESGDDNKIPFVFKSPADTSVNNASICNDVMFGEISLIRDLDEFLAEILPEEEVEVPDDNQVVTCDPEIGAAEKFVLNGVTSTSTVVETIDGGDVLGNAWKFTIPEESLDSKYLFRFDLFDNSEDFLNKEGLVYRIKASNGVFSNKMLNIKIGGTAYNNHFASSYILVNTLTGTITKSDSPDHRIYITEDEFEGYVILDLTDGHFNAGAGDDWKTFFTDETRVGKTIGAAMESSSNAGLFNDLVFGEVSFVDDINEFIDKATAPEKAGDANDDEIVDIRDLIRIKKYIADSSDTVINIFNAKLADKGSAPNASDLVAVRRMLLDNGSVPVTDEIGMAIWGLGDLSAWDAIYGEAGAAKDIFNYAGASSIENMRINATNGAWGWIKVTNLFNNSSVTEMNPTNLAILENKITGYKQTGVWDNIVGFITEEIRGSMTDEQYKILTKYLSVKYPGKRIAACLSVEEVIGTEAFYAAKGDEIPEGRNITPANFDTYQYTTDIAYDQYFTLDKAKYQEYNAILAENLAGLKYKQWYMPATYIQNDLTAEELTARETFMINHLNLMYELLLDDIAAGKDVGGLWLYGWHTYIEDDETGSVFLDKMNQYGDFSNLISRIVEIGKEINEMNDKY